MATKKQKRAAAVEKHEEFMAEVKRTGLKAQENANRKERERKEYLRKKNEREIEEKNKRHTAAFAHDIHKEMENKNG